MEDMDNPFAAHIASCDSDPSRIQQLYASKRTTRNAEQKARILDSQFPGWSVDPILARLDGPGRDPAFVDERHSIIFCASPPAHVKQLIGVIQRKLGEVAPNLWLAPHDNLHVTTLEIASSKTHEEMEEIMSGLTKGLADMVRCTADKHPRLVKPLLNADSAALALGFLPAAGEGADHSIDDQFTYHHLRRDLFSSAAATGVEIGSRYFVPSAHVTVARFITDEGFMKPGLNGQREIDHARVQEFVARVEEINTWLEAEYWPRDDGSILSGGEWIIGEDRPLECRKGKIWYGGGEDVVESYERRN